MPLPLKRVNADGPRNAKICLVGEAPGETEALSGIPFVGKAGQLLTRLLSNAGLSRSDCYITNVVKYRPPNNRMDRLSEININLDECYEEIRKEVIEGNHNVVVAIGAHALKALTGRSGITTIRGSILEIHINGKTIKVIPTIHPSYAIDKDPSVTPLIAADFFKVKRESEFTDFRSIKVRNLIIAPSFELVMSKLKEYQNELILSFDIESNKPFSYIKCLGFAPSAEEALCIPITHERKPYWSEAGEIAIWKEVRKLLRNPKVGKVIQGENFEQPALLKWTGEIRPVYMDTMLAHGVCYPELKKDLGVITSLYTNEPYFKDMAKEGRYEGVELWKYNCMDCAVTREVVEPLITELKAYKLTDLFFGYTMINSRMMCRASNHGILTDQVKVDAHIKELGIKAEEQQLVVNTLAGRELNVNSPDVRNVLYKELKMKAIKVKGKYGAADEETLEKLAYKYPEHKPLLDAILNTRRPMKRISTFLKGKADDDLMVRTTWKICGTETGRLSSSKNARNKGMNMQNIPEELRDIFIAPAGFVLIKADLSQVEARLVAYFTEDPAMMNIFETGVDIHSQVSAWVYDIPIEKVDRKTQRKKVKHVVHGANYDIGPRTFAYKIKVKESEARFLLRKYHGIFPGVKRWYGEIEDQLRKDRTLITPFGRRREFFSWWGINMFREAYANLPQGTAVDIINTGGIRADFQLAKDAIFLLQIHDELVMLCRVEDVHDMIVLLEREIEKPVIVNGHSVSIPVDIGIGRNWRDTIDYERDGKCSLGYCDWILRSF